MNAKIRTVHNNLLADHIDLAILSKCNDPGEIPIDLHTVGVFVSEIDRSAIISSHGTATFVRSTNGNRLTFQINCGTLIRNHPPRILTIGRDIYNLTVSPQGCEATGHRNSLSLSTF